MNRRQEDRLQLAADTAQAAAGSLRKARMSRGKKSRRALRLAADKLGEAQALLDSAMRDILRDDAVPEDERELLLSSLFGGGGWEVLEGEGDERLAVELPCLGEFEFELEGEAELPLLGEFERRAGESKLPPLSNFEGRE